MANLSTYKTQCVGFFTRTYKIKHNTDGPFLLRDRKKVSISILFQEDCVGWKFFTTNGGELE